MLEVVNVVLDSNVYFVMFCVVEFWLSLFVFEGKYVLC